MEKTSANTVRLGISGLDGGLPHWRKFMITQEAALRDRDSPASPRILLIRDPPAESGVARDFGSALAVWAGNRGYRFEEAVAAETDVKPCTGCLACYRNNGGLCVYADGYPAFRGRARDAGCLVLLSEIAFGQASVAIKQLIDKGIGVPWGLCGPFPAQLVVGYGRDLAEAEAACFLDIVRRHQGKAEALHRQLMGCSVEACVVQRPGDVEPALETLGVLLEGSAARPPREEHGRAIADPLSEPGPVAMSGTSRSVCLLNGSLREEASTSHFLLDALEAHCGGPAMRVTREALSLSRLQSGLSDLATEILGHDALVVALPLYCYALPAGLLRLLVDLGKRGPAANRPRLFAIVYSGAPFPEVNSEALRVLRLFAAKSGWVWGGGLAVGSGLVFKSLERMPLMRRKLDISLEAMARTLRGEACPPRRDTMVGPPIPGFVAGLVRDSMDRSAARKASRMKRMPGQSARFRLGDRHEPR
jgi:hypothetical protein